MKDLNKLNVEELITLDLSEFSNEDILSLHKRINKKVYKYSSHLIRLLYEGLEILTEGKITLPLNQNNFVRDIKLGRYSLNLVLKKAEEVEKLVDLAYVNSKLQDRADLVKINELQMELLEEYWEENK